MKSNGIIILALVAAATLAGGCDFMRKVAGRPTSAELGTIAAGIKERSEKEALEARQREEQEMMLRNQADSLAAAAALGDVVFKNISAIKVSGNGGMTARYAVVLGAFASPENAAKLIKTVSDAGYRAQELHYTSGVVGVVAGATDSFAELGRVYSSIKSEKFCPKDAWVLVNE